MHPAVLKTSQLILGGDVSSAEKALVTVAEEEGDHALVKVLDEVPARDLIAILREFDSSKESIISLLITPEQFARTIVMERHFGERDHDRLRGMINAVIHRDRETTKEYLDAIAAQEMGLDVLASYFEERLYELMTFATKGSFSLHDGEGEELDEESPEKLIARLDAVIESTRRDHVEGVVRSMPRVEIADGDWMETAWILRNELVDDFEHVLRTMRGRLKAKIQAEEEAARQEMTPDGISEDEESAI